MNAALRLAAENAARDEIAAVAELDVSAPSETAPLDAPPPPPLSRETSQQKENAPPPPVPVTGKPYDPAPPAPYDPDARAAPPLGFLARGGVEAAARLDRAATDYAPTPPLGAMLSGAGYGA